MSDKIKVRDRILNVASDLFSHQGFNQTGINQIIAEADIAIGSLYNHFPSKNDLLVAYLKKQEEESFVGFESISKGISNPKDKLFKFIDYRIRQQVSSDFAGCPFIKIAAEVGANDAKVLQIAEAYKEKQRALITGLFEQLETKNVLDTQLLADTLFLMIEGATVSTTISRNTQALENVKKFLSHMID